jgi:hypothetical protein
VAVKVLRPKIEKAFRRDIDAFYLAAWVIELLAPATRRLRPMDVIAHFEGVVWANWTCGSNPLRRPNSRRARPRTKAFRSRMSNGSSALGG